ncbi:phosphotransferase [Lederbergia citrea]|uniref:phosphotransferase n=1 Tax=Lederbergia citrea TaxID=2833581 RepID=UPI001BC90360|nr:phosphotransferase [Lederbergia citrea]MBS4204621.1 phosphotransferase [Lederbergia citrea]
MRAPHEITFDELLFLLNEQYGIQANQISFIPLGDKSFSYKVSCMDGEKFYLKLLDKQHQQEEILHTDYYLPLLSELHHKNLFPPAIHPIMNQAHQNRTELETAVLILFPWIEGDTLADAYPLSKEHVCSIAKIVGQLHLTTPNISNQIRLPVENFDLSFLDQLISHLNVPNHEKAGSALYQIVNPKEKEIMFLIELVRNLASSFNSDQSEFVICHGDLWGGNLIPSQAGIRIIDWESVILAPMERELAGYVSQRPADFIAAYSEVVDRKIQPNIDLLRFYAFQAQLRNLTNWMNNMLVHQLNEDQVLNDLDMIENHCLNRWDSIEESLQILESQLR